MSVTTANNSNLPTTNSKTEQRLYLEVPSSLKQLARLVVRGFYTVEDSLIIDMLVRNPCMKEDDICELLKFEKKQLRSRISILKNDKFIQIRLKMETGPDGKAQKVNYYFINYKTFVNVVKYKLDLMRKRMETEERDATSRASFKCTSCNKTFTDLEADQLFDFTTGEFRCTYCGSIVEEDMSALPKKDSRLLLAKFNDQLQPLFDLLREVEGIKLAPEVLEPEPVDIDTIRGITKPTLRPDMQQWSGEATRKQGFAVEETRVDINIGDNETTDSATTRKDRPVWMTESTVITEENQNNTDLILEQTAIQSSQTNLTSISSSNNPRGKKENDDNIMQVLLQHERQSDKSDLNKALKGLNNIGENTNNSSDDEKEAEKSEAPNVEIMNETDSDEDVPTVYVSGKPYPIDEINDVLISQMTPQEKDNYIQVYQEFYSHIYD